MFCSAKDSIPIHQKTNFICKVICLDCSEDYLGKTDCNLVTRLSEHGFLKNQPIYQYLSKWEHFALILDFIRLLDIDSSTTETNIKEHFVNAFIYNFAVFKSILHQKSCT